MTGSSPRVDDPRYALAASTGYQELGLRHIVAAGPPSGRPWPQQYTEHLPDGSTRAARSRPRPGARRHRRSDPGVPRPRQRPDPVLRRAIGDLPGHRPDRRSRDPAGDRCAQSRRAVQHRPPHPRLRRAGRRRLRDRSGDLRTARLPRALRRHQHGRNRDPGRNRHLGVERPAHPRLRRQPVPGDRGARRRGQRGLLNRRIGPGPLVRPDRPGPDRRPAPAGALRRYQPCCRPARRWP